MKHGAILPPAQTEQISQASFGDRVMKQVKAWRNFLLIVVAPTLIFATYQYLIASDQYDTTSDFLVKSGDNARMAPSAFGALLGIGGGTSQSESEIMSVPDYLQSHDVLIELRKTMDLVAIFRRPEADFATRLWDSNPDPETLLKYYRGKVKVRHDKDTGLMHLTVLTSRPQDSYQLAQRLLQLGELKINEMNRRSYADAIKLARLQLKNAEGEAAIVQRNMTRFREVHRDIDPEMSGQAQIKLVSELNGKLASARAQLGTMSGVISSDSPQYVALARQIASLESETATQARKLGGEASALAGPLGTFEELKVRQDFATKSYEAAAADLQRAIEQARKQQLYIVHVVDPNLPVRALFPERSKAVLTLLFGLVVAYAIGWLIMAGVREHES